MKRLKKESRVLEYKSQLKDGFHQIIKTVVAFANDIGGEIWVGVEDSGRVVGLEETVVENLLQDLPRSLFDAIQPIVPLEFVEKNIAGNLVLIIRIFSGPQKPYYVVRDGLPKGIYVRVGTSVMRAKQVHLDELNLVQRHMGYDQTIIPEVTLHDLDQTLLKQTYPTLNVQAMEHDGVLKRHLLSKELQVTVSGVLMFHPQPHRFVPEANINFCHFRTDDIKHPHKSMDIVGPLSVQLEDALVQLAKYLESDYALRGARLKATRWDIPQRALREAVANALFHRKYNVPSCIRISHFRSRVEIFSPGNFPGPMDMTNLGDGTSYIRNLSLCRVARKLGLLEKRGTGIKIMLEEAKNHHLKPPNFIEGGDFIKVLFFSEKSEQPEVEMTEWQLVQKLFEENPSITSQQVAQHLEVSKVTALKYLNQWIKEGFLKKKGHGPRSRYQRG